MARDHARIQCAIWADPDFVALPATAQRTYFVALSQPGLTYAGVVPYTPGRWSMLADGVTPAAVRRDVRTLVDRGFVVVDERSEEMLIRSFVKHDGIMRMPNVAKAMATAAGQIISPTIRTAFLDALAALHKERLERPVGDERGWDQDAVIDLLREAQW